MRKRAGPPGPARPHITAPPWAAREPRVGAWLSAEQAQPEWRLAPQRPEQLQAPAERRQALPSALRTVAQPLFPGEGPQELLPAQQAAKPPQVEELLTPRAGNV